MIKLILGIHLLIYLSCKVVPTQTKLCILHKNELPKSSIIIYKYMIFKLSIKLSSLILDDLKSLISSNQLYVKNILCTIK